MTEPSSALALTKRLIEIPSESTNKFELRRIIDFVRNYLDVPGIYIQEYESEGFPSLVATFEDTKSPQCMMVGHLDVVSADKEEFEAHVIENRLYGRGAGDMKGAVAVMIEVMRHLALRPEKPSVGLMLTTDEELGGLHGVHYLLEKEGYSSEIAIIPDSHDGIDTIILNQKGILQVKIEADGLAAHGSRPFLGENAIDKLMDMYGELRGAVKTVQSADEWGITMNLGRIRGGLAVNQVPDHAELHLDIRYAKSEESEHVLHEVKRITKGQFDVVAEGYPVDEDRDNAWIVKYADMLEKHGVEVKYDKEEGGSDARFFAEKQIPVIITGLQKGNIHSDKEWVVTDDLGQFQTILSQYLVENVRPVTLSQSAVV